MTHSTLAPFDAAAYAAAKPIYAVATDEAEQDGPASLSEAPSSLRSLAAANGFAGDQGAVLANDDGVLLGIGRGDNPFLVAAAADRLPEGNYRLDAASLTAGFGDEALSACLLAWSMGGYRFDRYRQRPPAAARLIAPEGVLLDQTENIADAVWLARDLVNTPAGDMLPDMLEKAVRGVAEEYGADVAVTEGDALLQDNFPMVHAVGRASAVAPRLIDLTWGDPGHPKVTLVGKGVCFDSGGLNLKPSNGIGLMKKDMGGAANALALAQLIMAHALPVRLRLLIPAVENAVAGSAFRPGDILPSRKGLSVEIGNTDAEGRLVLADAMTYGAEENPEVMITLATLTGAARVALGPDLPPFYCDDEAFADAVVRSAGRVRDPIWRMPLWPGYEAMLSSPIADMNNAPSGPFAGSITAALFLKRFAPADAIWGHFDIYAWRPKAAPGMPMGGEAQAIRALFDTFQKRYA